MSQHPSLSSSDKDKQHRSVLKRYEKVKILKDKEKWKDGDSVYGLPKVKIIRFKIKKEKAAAVEGAEGEALSPGAGATPTAAGAAKAAAPAKARDRTAPDSAWQLHPMHPERVQNVLSPWQENLSAPGRLRPAAGQQHLHAGPGHRPALHRPRADIVR